MNQYGEFNLLFESDLPPETLPVYYEESGRSILAFGIPQIYLPTDHKPKKHTVTRKKDFFPKDFIPPHGRLLHYLSKAIPLCDADDFHRIFLESSFSSLRSEAGLFFKELDHIIKSLEALDIVSKYLQAGVIQKHYWLSPEICSRFSNINAFRHMYRMKLMNYIQDFQRYEGYQPNQRKTRNWLDRMQEALIYKPPNLWSEE